MDLPETRGTRTTSDTISLGTDNSLGTDHVEVDLRPGTTVIVPMADGGSITLDIGKRRGRAVAVVRGATRQRPVATTRKWTKKLS